MRAALAGSVGLILLTVGACSQRAGSDAQPQPIPSTLAAYVPDVVGHAFDAARLELGEAQLVPIMRFAPELTTNPGQVVATEPKPGTQTKPGDVIVLVIAGKATEIGGEGDPSLIAINQLAAADEQSIVGIGRDPDGTTVVAFGPGVDPLVWRARVAAIMRDAKFRLQSCGHSLADLRGLQRMLGQRNYLPRAPKIAIGLSVDPMTCSVVMSGQFTQAEVGQLRQMYGDALTVRVARAARD